MNDFSRHLTAVWEDWRTSRGDFHRNAIATPHWPIPFFGNPAKATVATIGVNPSSGEFASNRRWENVKERSQWKCRLRDYFNLDIPPYKWFEPWTAGLPLLGVKYTDGSAFHCDASNRPTSAMLCRERTDPTEFRQMVERDIVWLFRLLPLCPYLRLLLTFGPIVCADGGIQGLLGFVLEQAPKYDFTVIPDGMSRTLRHNASGKTFCVHDADTRSAGDVTLRVINNLQPHRQELLRRLALGESRPTAPVPALGSPPQQKGSP